jgi:predicted transcriptional regulator
MEEEERPSELVGVRVSPAEKRLIQQLAKASGSTESEIGRWALQNLLGLRATDQAGEENP